MAKQFFKRFNPHFAKVRTHPKLQCFGNLLHDPNLWHFNRRSLSGGMAVGLFAAFVPIPMQMILAAAIAILLRVNLPLSVSLVWLTNPITMPPIYYGCYKLGTYLLRIPPENVEFCFSMECLSNMTGSILQPFLLGSFVIGILSASTGYLLVNILWRLHVRRSWRERIEKRILAKRVLSLKRTFGSKT